MWYLIPYWYFTNKYYIYSGITKKRARNYVSFIHSIMCMLSLFINSVNIDFIYNLSLSYFIYDICYIVFNKHKSDAMYVLHHVLAILYLNEMSQEQSYLLFHWYGIAELSNLFTYIVYDLIKIGYSDTFLHKIKFVQLCWFTFFRVIYTTYILIYYCNYMIQLKSFFSIISLVMLGYTWSGCLTYKYLKNINY